MQERERAGCQLSYPAPNSRYYLPLTIPTPRDTLIILFLFLSLPHLYSVNPTVPFSSSSSSSLCSLFFSLLPNEIQPPWPFGSLPDTRRHRSHHHVCMMRLQLGAVLITLQLCFPVGVHAQESDDIATCYVRWLSIPLLVTWTHI